MFVLLQFSHGLYVEANLSRSEETHSSLASRPLVEPSPYCVAPSIWSRETTRVASCRQLSCGLFTHAEGGVGKTPSMPYATIVSRCFEKNRKEPRVNAMLRWVHVVSLRMM
jgi:hypothetical protein